MCNYLKKTNKTIILDSGEIVHDFRPKKLSWGWNKLFFKVISKDNRKFEMMGIGRGLKVGDFIALNQGEEDFGCKIIKIEYKTNPNDMFEAALSGVYGFDEGELD